MQDDATSGEVANGAACDEAVIDIFQDNSIAERMLENQIFEAQVCRVANFDKRLIELRDDDFFLTLAGPDKELSAFKIDGPLTGPIDFLK